MTSRATNHASGISADKTVEERLKESEAQYRSIFEATSDGLIINDYETGLVAEVNPAFCAMHGMVPIAAGYAFRIVVEERALREQIGAPYAEYMARTFRLIPGVW